MSIARNFESLREALVGAARYLAQDLVAGVDRDETSSESESEQDKAERAEGERLNAQLYRDDEGD